MVRLCSVAACVIPLVLLGCTEDAVVRTDVGSSAFCVPKSNAIEVSGWVSYATQHFPHSGFAFLMPPDRLPKSFDYKPSLSVRGDPLPITGVVDVESRGMIDHPPTDHHWVKYAKAQGASIRIDAQARTLTAFEDSNREFWVVWRVAEGQDLSPQSLPAGARVLATCRKTIFGQSPASKVRESTSCERTIAKDGLRISYSFGEANLAILPALDAAVVEQLNVWRCKVKSAA
jgi:hypothetical protein